MASLYASTKRPTMAPSPPLPVCSPLCGEAGHGAAVTVAVELRASRQVQVGRVLPVSRETLTAPIAPPAPSAIPALRRAVSQLKPRVT